MWMHPVCKYSNACTKNLAETSNSHLRVVGESHDCVNLWPLKRVIVMDHVVSLVQPVCVCVFVLTITQSWPFCRRGGGSAGPVQSRCISSSNLAQREVPQSTVHTVPCVLLYTKYSASVCVHQCFVCCTVSYSRISRTEVYRKKVPRVLQQSATTATVLY